ncbi:hypothetical protein AB0M95_18410 [Sphaerisporangium sp. NPDC051017]|uniref:hypothetical protein n=1 Tax=Sphaerisporangium sp. NPDC051017 TaxID=3154636 RepID=UPI0034286D6A
MSPAGHTIVDAAIAKFEHHTHAGLHLEKLESALDPNVRTIRIDVSWRGVVLAPATGGVFCLVEVLPLFTLNGTVCTTK